MADSATIVAASLSDKELRDSVTKLVNYFDDQMKIMAVSTNITVDSIEKKLKSLGNIKIDSGGAADGGSSRRAKLFSQEGEVIQRNNQIAKEYNATLDQQAAAIRKASQVSVRTGDAGSIRNADTLQTMNIQLDLLRERLREARQQYSSFVAMASSATKTGDKGLYQFATEGVHKYGDEVRTLIPQIRGLQNAIQQMGDVIAPQGHTIQNYVNSLQKTNPELAQLNEQFKKGQSELQNQSTSYSNATQSAQRYTEEIRKQAQAIRESAQWREKGYATVGGVNVYNLEKDTTPLKQRISLEEQLVQLHKSEESSMMQQAADEEKVAQATRLTGEELKKIYQDQKAINEEINKRANGVRNGGTTPFQSYDSLRQSIASVLGIQEQQVKMANTEKDSYNQLSSTLKQLRQAYDALSKSDRNSDQGKVLVASIHEVERAMQQIRAQAARPLSLESLIGINGRGGLSEKTLDDIAYKMRQLASYRSGLNVDTQKKEISTVNAEYDRLKKKMDEVMQKNSNIIASNNALGRSWNYMKNRLAFYFTVGASTQFIKNLIEVRSQYEMNERALGILINSAERGTQIFNELSQMALVSPYTLIELSAAAKQLTAYDIAARDVVDTTRRLADMASAVGVPIERLTYALGQIKAYGYLNSRDARMFANAGIPLVKQLSDYYTELEGKMVSTADVYDRMKKKAIDYNSVMSVITKMTDEGGKFFDFQAKMADTLKVRLANLTLAWNNMLNDMGKETQGVLTWSIGALRSLFLQWKNLYGALNEVSLVFGVAKALQFLGVCAHAAGVGFGSLNKYMTLNALLGTRLATTVRTLGNAFMSLVRSPLAWFTMAALLVTEIGDAFINSDRATKEFNESLRDGAKTTYEDLKKFAEQYKNIRDSLYTTQKTAIGNIYDPSTGKAAATAYANQTVGQDISASEAKKVWEAMREQIELSSHASDEYISKLLSIENVSERLRQGFQILDDIQTVSAALKEIGEDGIKVTQGWAAWWNAWQGADGLIGNVKDLQKEIQRLKDAGQDPNDKFTKVIDKDYARSLERFRSDLKVTTDSVIDFINLNGWSGDIGKIDEVFKQVTDRLATQGNLDPQTAFTLQREVEVARAKAAKEALEIRIADEKSALAAASDEISKQQIQKNLETLEQQKRDFDKFNGENRAYWNDFTKYIKERHISELTAAYNSMTDHGKKAMDFQSEEWQKYVHDWANRYEKSHNLATDSVFNRLRNWINDANTWSVFIKMTISTEDGKSVYKQLEEYDKAADDAWKTMQRLDKRISQLRKKGAKEVEGAETGAIDLSRVSQDDRELTEALKERTQAQEDYNNAVEKGGESKKENSAASKAQKAAESELQKALKDELQLIDRVRSQYKKLTDAGANSGEALAYVTNQFGNSLARINSILGKNGIPLFDISKFAGTDNPQALLDMLKLQLDSAKIAKNIKPEEIKELEVKYSEIVVDAKAYNLTKITKGLNNELDRLKEEYELAVSLDADPELGNMFADWMGIDVSDLPRTASEYAERASKILNNKLKDLGAKTELPNVLDITDDDMRAFEENKTFTDKQLELVKKAVEAARGFQRKETEERIKDWDKLLEKYAEYETKINRIQNDAVKERVSFAQQFGSDEEKSMALKLQTQILAATDPQEKQKLIEQLRELVLRIAGDDKTKINLVTAIDNSQDQGIAKTNFEEFQKSPEWVTATGNLADMSKSAIRTLIADIEHYKRTAKNLTPKQIKDINKALKQLYTEQRKNNPFAAISNMLDEAKERAENFNIAIADTDKELEELQRVQASNQNKGVIDPKTDEKIEKTNRRLAELIKKKNELEKPSASAWVESIKETIGAIEDAISLVDGLVKAISGVEESDLDKIFSVVSAAGQGAATGAKVGGAWGAVIGAVIGAGTKLTQILSNAYNENINKQIKYSEDNVKLLATAYNKLKRAIDEAYGADYLGLKKLQLANKQMELVEVQRQLQLERSRKNKNKDFDKITELEDKVDELQHEIKNAAKNIIMDLTGISDSEDWAESLVDNMIDAFKKGEDYMESYKDSFDDMIDSMIAKAIVGRLIGDRIEEMFKMIYDRAEQRAKTDEGVLNAKKEMDNLQAAYDLIIALAHDKGTYVSDEVMSGYQKALEEAQEKYAKAYSNAARPTPEDVQSVRDMSEGWRNDVKTEFEEYMSLFGIEFGSEKAKKELSALQQGIQGITETTAGALEAYMNGVSQQVYYQSDILTQIRDAVVSFNLDVQVATMSQILLQLQSSYTVQMSIQGILEGWSSPSGLAVRVEMQ